LHKLGTNLTNSTSCKQRTSEKAAALYMFTLIMKTKLFTFWWGMNLDRLFTLEVPEKNLAGRFDGA
jgi:hypothetical protein